MKKIYKLILGLLVVCLIIVVKDIYQQREAKKEQVQSHIHKKQIQNKQAQQKLTSTKSYHESNDIDKYLKSKGFNGNITIYKNNRPIMSKAYGFRDVENGIVNDAKSMYLLGSANKFITGLMLRELEEQGVININDNVNKYIPNFQNIYPITIKDLMLHRSGLAKANFPPTARGLNGAIESIKLNGVVHQNYHKYFYNDANYIIIAKVIENATHKSYKQNLNELIINKAHLKYTARFDSINHQQYMVNGYKLKNNQYIYFYPATLDKYDGAGNIYISTDDMAKLVNQFKNKQILNGSSTDILLSKIDTHIFPSSYRYGFYRYPYHQRYRGIFYQNDFVTYSNDQYIVSIASNVLKDHYKNETEDMLKHIFKDILKQKI
ncbi:class A beta-lactamase-related serine hydrolase [Mammaliicoccus sciuri]|uniref:serine hydrolase domain-containing protein n=1 Tax=Mammaliicoccus sciuri TaxID=1296 RepID=UPI000E699A66|nr:serine hydrolase domain-containing protein [Mammaliicoccus sciuri]RIO17872.1 class A beta-lactamase-related serine hydrolase [Mammaliicoccus sciuri]